MNVEPEQPLADGTTNPGEETESAKTEAVAEVDGTASAKASAADPLMKVPPPTPSRVQRRALILLALGCRGSLELHALGQTNSNFKTSSGDATAQAGSAEPSTTPSSEVVDKTTASEPEPAAEPPDPAQIASAERTRGQVWDWIQAQGGLEELEPAEAEQLQTPVGQLPITTARRLQWHLESAAVLAWALQLFELPPFEQETNPGQLAEQLGFLSADAAARLAQSTLRPLDTLHELHNRYHVLHWRLRTHVIEPGRVNLLSLLMLESFYTPVQAELIPMRQGELIVHDRPVYEYDEASLRHPINILYARHLAASWLIGVDTVFSQIKPGGWYIRPANNVSVMAPGTDHFDF